MTQERKKSIEFIVKTLAIVGLGSVGVFVAVRAALARDGVVAGAPRSFLTVAGTLTGVTGAPSATFHFRRDGAATDACAPTATITNLDPVSHAFSVEVPIESCAGLLDGSDVTVTVDLGSSPALATARVNPTPYAVYAGVAGLANATRRAGPYGLSLSYDAASTGQLCVQCGGRPCSDTNPGFVAFDNATPPERITTSPCIRDGRVTGSDLANHPFGTTRGVAWPEDRPFALYACRASSGVHFALSPDPTKLVAPDASAIVSTATPSGTSETDSTMFVWGGAAVSGNRCLRIGALRMRKDSGDRWTVSALDAMDGIDQDADFGVRTYVMPPGQRGAPADNYLHFDYPPSSAWVLPTYRRIRYSYSIGVDGMVDGAFFFKNVDTDTGTVPGSSTTTNMVLVLPFETAPEHLASDRMGSGNAIGHGTCGGTFSGTPFSTTFVVQVGGGDNAYLVYDVRSTSSTSSNNITPNHQGGADRSMRGQFRYRAFP